MHDLSTRASRLQSLSSLQATRADALDSLLSYTLRLRWLAAAYMFVYAVVITYFELGTLALRIPESANPTRV
eukprot:3276964-Pleurochrysis_carterae.AAC.1